MRINPSFVEPTSSPQFGTILIKKKKKFRSASEEPRGGGGLLDPRHLQDQESRRISVNTQNVNLVKNAMSGLRHVEHNSKKKKSENQQQKELTAAPVMESIAVRQEALKSKVAVQRPVLPLEFHDKTKIIRDEAQYGKTEKKRVLKRN